jgi:hypothetical protein
VATRHVETLRNTQNEQSMAKYFNYIYMTRYKHTVCFGPGLVTQNIYLYIGIIMYIGINRKVYIISFATNLEIIKLSNFNYFK